MRSIKAPILPARQAFFKNLKDAGEVNLKAICIFVSTGFFLDQDTYFKNEVCLSPAHKHQFDDDGLLIKSTRWFDWHYSPRSISFDSVLEEYIDLLTAITKDQVNSQKVILPLSGGLDSRSQALVLKKLGNPVQSYSYSFKGGYPEHKISEKIAATYGFDFDAFQIEKGYLWSCIDELAQINNCYSEFTHPRQMAILPQLKQMDGVFSLGHWGDVFFDRGVPDGTTEANILPLLFKKMVRPDGFKLAQRLWQHWELEGNFKDYLLARIETSLSKIKIDNLSAKVRAFKTSQWAHRWTTTNLSIFEAAHPITLPYYDDRMCQFICTVPEEYLADRRLQLAHLKQDKALSNITWHEQKPFNLNNYNYNKLPYNLPYRVISKLNRIVNGLVGNPYIQRNFELQFLGNDNDEHLKARIFETNFNQFIPKEIVEQCHSNFKSSDYANNAHAVSMLLTLSLWNKHFYNFNQ